MNLMATEKLMWGVVGEDMTFEVLGTVVATVAKLELKLEDPEMICKQEQESSPELACASKGKMASAVIGKKKKKDVYKRIFKRLWNDRSGAVKYLAAIKEDKSMQNRELQYPKSRSMSPVAPLRFTGI